MVCPSSRQVPLERGRVPAGLQPGQLRCELVGAQGYGPHISACPWQTVEMRTRRLVLHFIALWRTVIGARIGLSEHSRSSTALDFWSTCAWACLRAARAACVLPSRKAASCGLGVCKASVNVSSPGCVPQAPAHGTHTGHLSQYTS